MSSLKIIDLAYHFPIWMPRADNPENGWLEQPPRKSQRVANVPIYIYDNIYGFVWTSSRSWCNKSSFSVLNLSFWATAAAHSRNETLPIRKKNHFFFFRILSVLRDCALLVEVFSPEIHQPILETLGGSPHGEAGLRHSKATEPGVELPKNAVVKWIEWTKRIWSYIIQLHCLDHDRSCI